MMNGNHKVNFPLKSITTTNIEEDLSILLNKIDHSIFGVEVGINNYGVNKFIITPAHLLTNKNQTTVDTRGGQFESYNCFEGCLSSPYFLPLRIDLNGHFEKQINLLKEIVKKDEDIVILWLFKKKYQWKYNALDMYRSYLKGNDYPSTVPFVRNIQQKTIKGLDKLASFESNREYSEDVEQKILDKGFDSQLKVLVKSDRHKEITELIHLLLEKYDSHNRLRLSNIKVDNPYNFINQGQMLSLSEIYSLFGGKAKEFIKPEQEIDVIDKNSTPSTPISDNIIELLPYLKKEEVKIDESLVEKLAESMKKVGIIKQARLYDATIQSGSRLTVITSKLPPDVNFSKIESKSKDIRVNLGVQSLGIEQGDVAGTIKFSIPNNNHQIISLREMIERKDFQEFKKNNPLAFIVGMDELNSPIYLSLAKLVHLLIAGSTGSGKSVFINTVLTVLLMCYKPNELRMFLIDPKQVELSQYQDFPHVQKVITDMSETITLLESLAVEMDRRYDKFGEFKGVKNIIDYNKQSKKKMQYIVIAIDEFKDLKDQYPDVDSYVGRLGQKARAAGIHLIVATQRPSADVIEGTTKSNLQNAISFNLGSNRNYRTVFDEGIPYENLLGNGDGVMRIEGYPKEFQRFQSSIIHPDGKEEGKIFDSLIQYYKEKDYDIGEEIPIGDEGRQDIPLIDQLKTIIATTKNTRIGELRKDLGVKGTTMTDLFNQLIEEGWIKRHNSKAKGYELIADEEILKEWQQ
ncbi:FtsK/SpoIIIE domain-containing protein [Aquibacillus saliphilus]|uniref:FtsK/SpoIIIE domain-containing protein n=1 Tax=Aquibacillus saliphilus TaxID=1909422 RepID=UPI001CF0C8E7|nr:FtsK/SpoIIIE domain-containing protein [Aquibacillus saliphilus]